MPQEASGPNTTLSGEIHPRLCYTTKMKISQMVDEEITMNLFGEKRYFVWFTKRFNYRGDQGSNPLALYKLFDEAAEGVDLNPLDIRRRRERLVDAILDHLDNGHHSIAVSLIHSVKSAPLNDFAPMVWTFPDTELSPGMFQEVAPGEFKTTQYVSLNFTVAIPAAQ